MVATINSESRGNDALPVCLCPWLENPYGLVSLWEMERFAGESLHDAIRILDSIRYTWWFAAPAGDAAAALMMGQERVLTLDERRSVEESLRHVEVNIRRSGLLTSGEAITEFRTELISWDIPGFGKLPARTVAERIDDIQRTIRREMKTVVFMCLTSQSARRFSFPLEDWDGVIGRWPKMGADIGESSRCFALDRFAASIFHILLVAEFGVIQVGDLLGESGDRPGWGCAERLERILQKPYKERTPLGQKHSALLKDIVPMVVAVKDSSRHKISHVDNKLVWLDADFSPQIASEVISATRGFMRRLAKELP